MNKTEQLTSTHLIRRAIIAATVTFFLINSGCEKTKAGVEKLQSYYELYKNGLERIKKLEQLLEEANRRVKTAERALREEEQAIRRIYEE